MIGHRREHARRHLRAGGIVEEHEAAGRAQRRKLAAQIVDREDDQRRAGI